jgi:hypothetical protein
MRVQAGQSVAHRKSVAGALEFQIAWFKSRIINGVKGVNNAKATTPAKSFPKLLDDKPASPSGDAGSVKQTILSSRPRGTFQYPPCELEDQLFTFPSVPKTTVRKWVLPPLIE